MLFVCRGLIALSFHTHTKHRNKLLWQKVEFLKLIMLLHKVTIRFYRANEKLFDVGQFSNRNAVLFAAETGVFTFRYSIKTG